MQTNDSRRQILGWAAAAAGGMLLPSLSWAAPKMPAMTEGPFYPLAKDLPLDQDNDLTRLAGKSGVASGVLLDLSGRLLDENDRPQRNALVEIWQCNANGRYHHSRDDSRAPLDPFFQGFGKIVTDAEGRYRFRTIKPVAYPGRVPHIHVKVKSRDFGELTSQIFVAGEAGNERDFVLRSMGSEAERKRVMMTLKPAAADAPVKLTADFDIVLG
jgi:protocatechuate 3,4-dioxygenase, beta subunit